MWGNKNLEKKWGFIYIFCKNAVLLALMCGSGYLFIWTLIGKQRKMLSKRWWKFLTLVRGWKSNYGSLGMISCLNNNSGSSFHLFYSVNLNQNSVTERKCVRGHIPRSEKRNNWVKGYCLLKVICNTCLFAPRNKFSYTAAKFIMLLLESICLCIWWIQVVFDL